MTTVSLEFPDEVLEVAGQPIENFGRDLRIAAATRWYERGEVSQGFAAMVAGVSRSEFLDILSRANVSIWQITPEEIEAELAHAR
jgi:predicted HTH domain antitoxin